MVSKVTKVFGLIHLGYYLIVIALLITALVFLNFDQDSMNGLLKMNDDMSQLGTAIYAFIWLIYIVIIALLIVTIIYFLLNLIFYIRCRLGKISLVMMILNIIIAILSIGQGISGLVVLFIDEFNIIELLFGLTFIGPITGLLYSIFALRDRDKIKTVLNKEQIDNRDYV